MLVAGLLIWGFGVPLVLHLRTHHDSANESDGLPRSPASLVNSGALQEFPAPELPICHDFYNYICKHHELSKGDGRDPTGIVHPDVEGERIADGFLKDIIQKHPDWTSDQVDEELVKEVYTPERTARVQAAYRWVQNRIVHLIESQPEHVFTSREKREIVARVKKTELQLPPPASNYADEPDLFTRNDVFYERTPEGQMRMRIGGAYLFTAKSWFNIIFTMGHELGHSIDPCEIRQARLSYPAYDRLTACFLRTGLVQTSNTRSECGENDQLSETFADWIGTQVSAEALKTFSNEFHGAQLINATANSVRDLCEQDDQDNEPEELDTSTHPSPKVRIEKIFGDQPGIRSVLGCAVPEKSVSQYCSFESQNPLPNALKGPMGNPANGLTNGKTSL